MTSKAEALFYRAARMHAINLERGNIETAHHYERVAMAMLRRIDGESQ